MAVGTFGSQIETQAMTLGLTAKNDSRTNLFKVTDGMYALFYESTTNVYRCASVAIDSAGAINGTPVDEIQVISAPGDSPQCVVQVTNNLFILSAPPISTTLTVRTIQVTDAGVVTIADSLDLTSITGVDRALWHKLTDTVVVGIIPASANQIVTLSVGSDGTLATITGPSALGIASVHGFVRANGSVFAVATGELGSQVDIYTITINDDGTFSTTQLDTANLYGDLATILHMIQIDADNGVVALTIHEAVTGSVDKQHVYSIVVDGSGNITSAGQHFTSTLSNLNYERPTGIFIGSNSLLWHQEGSTTLVTTATDASANLVNIATSAIISVATKGMFFAAVSPAIMAAAHNTTVSGTGITITTFELETILGAEASTSLVQLCLACYKPLNSDVEEAICFNLFANEWREKIDTKALALDLPELENEPLALNYAVMTIQLRGVLSRAHAPHPIADPHEPDLIDMEEAAMLFNRGAPSCLPTLKIPLVSGDRTYKGIIERVTLVENPGTDMIDYTLVFKVAWNPGIPAFRGWT